MLKYDFLKEYCIQPAYHRMKSGLCDKVCAPFLLGKRQHETVFDGGNGDNSCNNTCSHVPSGEVPSRTGNYITLVKYSHCRGNYILYVKYPTVQVIIHTGEVPCRTGYYIILVKFPAVQVIISYWLNTPTVQVIISYWLSTPLYR